MVILSLNLQVLRSISNPKFRSNKLTKSNEHYVYDNSYGAPLIKQECSVNSPDYGPLPSEAPVWCLAPFDPEGLLR
jgi:hypothetical protein